jgi:hypothetical protein
MELNAEKKTHSPQLNALSTSTIIQDKPYNNKYFVHLSKRNYSVKPEKKPSLFKALHTDLNNAQPTELTLTELLETITQGYVFKNGAYTKKEQDEKPTFTGTDLAILDIDDVLGKTDPEKVMRDTHAMALYYSYSHNEMSPVDTRMNRYRLLYDLNSTITDLDFLKFVQEQLKDNLIKLYPALRSKNINGKANGIDNLTSLIFGTNKGYIINPDYRRVNAGGLKELYDNEQAFIRVTNAMRTTTQPTDEHELIQMAEHLGDTQGLLPYDEYAPMVIGLFNTAQIENIPDEIILEVLNIIDGNRESDKARIRNYKKPVDGREKIRTVATFIKLATDNGFKRDYSQQPMQADEQGLKIALSTLNIEKYVDTAAFVDILENEHVKNLVISDTNTGKTYASITASREYLKQDKNRFVYIALPTKSLAEQVADEYETGAAIKGNMNVEKAVKQALYDDTRLLVGTYDKAPIVYKYLQDKDVTVIADEVHKEVTDYNYRYKAIQALFELASHENVSNFVGLTGTPDEIDKQAYDCITKFELSTPKVLADTLQFIEYNKATEYELVTTQAILKEVEQGNKVLAFINNKDLINKLAKALRDRGLRVTTATADAQQQDKSHTFKKLLHSQKIESDVVLSTIVLADGININNTKDYVCMIAPNHYKQAHFYNIDLIRQATNRFRNQYKKIVIPFYINSDVASDTDNPRNSDKLYSIEQQYSRLLDYADVTKTVIETEFKDKLNLYKPSIAERLSGLFNPVESYDFNFILAYENKARMEQGLTYDTELQSRLDSLESKFLTIDTRAIRQQASHDKEHYYSLHPYAFKRAITGVLDVLSVQSIYAYEYLLDDSSELETALDKLDKLKIDTDKEKREHLSEILHEIIFYKVKQHYQQTGKVNQSLTEWKLLKKNMNPLQYAGLTNVIRFLDYDQTIKELDYIKKKAQVNELEKQFSACFDLETFNRTDRNTVTKLIYKEIEPIAAQGFFLKSVLDEALDAAAKSFKIKQRYTIAKRQQLFKQVFKKYFVRADTTTKKRSSKTLRVSLYKPVTLEHVAATRELETHEIAEQYYNYIYSKKFVR